MSREHILKVRGLGIDFGGLTAVNGLDLDVYEGEIVGLIGPNGAGKTTVFNMLTHVYKPSRGEIIFCGENIASKNIVETNQAGIARPFQNIRLFNNLSVLDNVRIGYHNTITYSPLTAVLRLPAFRKQEKEITEKSMELLKILGLGDQAEVIAGNLPYGAQRRLEIARALASGPKLLLLDEPSMGLAPILVDEIFRIIQQINREGTTILLVEQNAYKALSIANRAYILETGMVTMEGPAQDLIANDAVKSAYLGG